MESTGRSRNWMYTNMDGHKTNIGLGDSELAGPLDECRLTSPSFRRESVFAALLHMWNDEVAVSHIRWRRASPDGMPWTVYDDAATSNAGIQARRRFALVYEVNMAREFVQNTRPCDDGCGRPRIISAIRRIAVFTITNEPHNFAAYSQRRVFQCRSHDFLHWSEPVLVAAADDEEDNLDDSFYGMSQFKLGNVHLATVGVFQAVDNEMEVLR